MNGREAIQWFAGKYVNAPNNSETMNILAGDLESDDVRSKVEAKFLSYFAESQELRLRKQADYGLSWRDMGLLGVFCNIVSKVWRLKQLVWLANDPQVKGESVRDTLIDLLNYVLYAIFLLEEGNIRGPQE